jgi:hypothetical protein
MNEFGQPRRFARWWRVVASPGKGHRLAYATTAPIGFAGKQWSTADLRAAWAPQKEEVIGACSSLERLEAARRARLKRVSLNDSPPRADYAGKSHFGQSEQNAGTLFNPPTT